MNIVRFLLVCVMGCLLAADSGCRRSAYKMWGYSLTNYGGETFLNANVFRGSGSHLLGPGALVFVGTGYVGVFGRMPRAVTIAFASKDKRRHRIYVLVPRRPRGYGSKSPEIYFVVEGRCKAITTWQDPGLWPKLYFEVRNVTGASAVTINQRLDSFRMRTWRICPANIRAGSKSSKVESIGEIANVSVSITNVHDDRWFRIWHDVPQHVEVDYTWHGRVHKVPVTLPLPRLVMRPWPRIYFTINRHGQLTVRRKLQGPQRWFCAVGDNGKRAFSNLKVTADGKSYPLGGIGPESDASLSALGPMPKALKISFTSPDGKQHKVRVQAAAASTFHGSKTPELYLLIGSHAKLAASWICPQLLKYKPPPHWTCSISYTGAGTISHVTIAYHGTPPYTVADVIGTIATGLTMNPKGIAPKAVDLGFTTADGKRHTVHLILPAFHGSGTPSFTLTIEKGGKVVATANLSGGVWISNVMWHR